MTDRRLISALLPLVLVFGAAGAITASATFLVPAPPQAIGTAYVAGAPRYSARTLARAARTLPGSTWLVGRDEPETAKPEAALPAPVPYSKPATPEARPDPAPVPEKDAKPAPAPVSPPTVREERPQQPAVPAPRTKDRPTADKPVVV